MVLSWIYDITPKGIQKTEELSPEQKASITKLSWKPSWISVILFVFVVLISFAFFTVPRPNTLGFQEQDWILIADLDNKTGEEVFNHSLIHALTVTIEQSKRVNIYPRNKVLEVLTRMQVENAEHIDVPMAMEIAERENIKAVLLLSIAELGGTYLLIADLLDPYSGATVRSRQIKADGKEDILQSLDHLAKTILKDLGESLQHIHLHNIPLMRASTPSLDALRSLTKAYYTDRFSDKAFELYREAIELDPEFALAHAELGRWYYMQNNRTLGEEHCNKALTLLERLTEHERLWIQAIIPMMRGNREEADTRWDLYLNEFPDSYQGWFNKGYNHMRAGLYEKAIEAFTRAADIYKEKDPGVLLNIATCQSVLKNYQQAIDYYLEAFKLDPELLTSGNINNEFGFTYLDAGEPDKAREVFEEMIKGNDEDKAKGYRSLALLSMYTGQLSKAAEQIQESTLLNKTLGYELSALRNRLYLAKIYHLQGRKDKLLEELNQLNERIYDVATEPVWYLILGKMFVRIGEYKEAELMLGEMDSLSNEGNKYDEGSCMILKGELELARGNLSEAKDLLETASILREDAYALESLAHYHFTTGNLEKAIEVYEQITELPSMGWETQECWVRAHFSLGKAYEAIGNNEKAILWYQRFLSIWEEADRDLPDLMEAESSVLYL
jgi:tetratricopeptide (TPR) repeat protein